jgi:ubiquinone/menaquinone biosynthesis C-methylase UbiE
LRIETSMDIKDIYRKEKEAGRYYADKYTDAYNALFYKTARENIAKTITKRFKERPLHILDMGCGPGNLAQEIKVFMKEDVFVMDISEDMLKEAKKSGIRHGVCGVTEDLPFKDMSFDAVAGFSILHHLLDLKKAFKEIARVLKPGGFFIFGEPFEIPHLSIWKARVIYGPYFIYYKVLKMKNQNELRALEEANFDKWTTEIHRHLSIMELNEALGGLPLVYKVKRFGVTTPFFGTSMFPNKRLDRIFFGILSKIDCLYSRLCERFTQEGIIWGEKL